MLKSFIKLLWLLVSLPIAIPTALFSRLTEGTTMSATSVSVLLIDKLFELFEDEPATPTPPVRKPRKPRPTKKP